MKKKVLLIGPVPPPAGGVSIHITRLAHLLASQFTVQLIDESRVQKEGVLNIRKFNPALYLKTIVNNDIVHIHSGTRLLKYAHIVTARLLGKKTILTIHSYKKKPSYILSLLDSWIYSLPHSTIMVTSDFSSRIKLRNNAVVKHAFLPPVMHTEQPLPLAMAEWVAAKKKLGYQVAVANAWRLDTHNGEDLYGLDLCIDAALKLQHKQLKICFVFVVCDLGGHLDIKKYEKEILDKDLKDVFYLHTSQISFVNLVKETDIVLRPTNTDGDALTIREALFLHKSVIASDIVIRPEGVSLFTTRNADSLADIIEKVASERENARKEIAGEEDVDFSKYYKDLYVSSAKPE